MGAALSSRAEWTSASETGRKLDFSRANESLLREIVEYVEKLCKENPREAEVLFKRPLVWKSPLKLSDLQTLSPPDYISSDQGIVSAEKQSDGEPVFSVAMVGKGVEIRSSSLIHLTRVLVLAGEKKLREAQLCLEANPDPVAAIMGPAYATVHGQLPGSSKTLLEVHERLSREKMLGNASTSVNELDSSFRLLLLLNSLDLQLLHSSVTQLGRGVRLNPEAVQVEVELLKQFSGDSQENSCLKSVSYTSDLTFSNGCRAPPWRQVLGDICYLLVQPWDTEQLCITASTEGYFVNKGLLGGEVEHERVGDIHPTLNNLLKAKSTHFSHRIVQQEFVYKEQKGDRRPEDDELFTTAPEVVIEAEEPAQSVPADQPAADSSPQTSSQAAPTVKQATGDHKAARGGRRGSKADELFVSAPTCISPSISSRRSRAAGTTGGSFKLKSMSSIQTSHPTDIGEESDSSSEGSEEEEISDRRPESNADLPSEYWQIQKLIKYLKAGNQTATVISLCYLLDFDLTQETSHLAIKDSGGLDLLINLLETEDIRCRVGTLRILREISKNSQTRTAIVDLKGLPQLVEMLRSPNRELKCLAAETIANIASFHRARKIVRVHGGLKLLVDMLQDPGRPGSPITGERSDMEVARSASLGLWSCSKGRKNRQALLKTNAVRLLGRLLKADSEDMLIPVIGTLQEFASEPQYQQLIQSEGMVEHLIRGLNMDNKELQMHCAAAIFKCAEEEETRLLVRDHGGMAPLSNLLTVTGNKQLLTEVTGALWKCSMSLENVQQLRGLKAVEKLVALLSNQPEEVLVNVVGALGECAAKDAENRAIIRKAGGVVPLIQLLTGTNQALLINTTRAVGACALEPESMTIIDKQDGVRLLWSLLKSPNPEVQACAAWAICPCIQNAKDAGELVRSFVGGLELIVGLLKSTDNEVLASVCAAIAKIAQDQENLAVITDHGVVPMLAQLTNTSNDLLRRHLSDAIAKCCSWRNNRIGFGQNCAVAPLVSYLHSENPDVHRSTACALYQLSSDPDNCITMHEAGVVQLLVPMVGSSDEVLQEAAASCISNIRQLALANEKARYR